MLQFAATGAGPHRTSSLTVRFSLNPVTIEPSYKPPQPGPTKKMLERLQKIIARAGIASRRHAEQLILSGQVRVNGQVITELGSKADTKEDRIEAAGKLVEANERRVYIVLNKPPEVVSTLADPEGRKTLRNCLKGLPERVYPVGRLDYDASGLVFLTNDGDLAAEMLKDWANLQQHYHVKIKGRLMMEELERLGRNAGATIRTVRQPDATRGHAENFWYEVALQDSKKDILRRVLFAEKHPVEKLKRIALGPLTLEGLPQGRYRLLIDKEVDELRHALKTPRKPRAPFVPSQDSSQEDARLVMHYRPFRPENRVQPRIAGPSGHRKHGPRPSRPPSPNRLETQDVEEYRRENSPEDRSRPVHARPHFSKPSGSRPSDSRPRDSRSGDSRPGESRPSRPFTPGRPSGPGRPNKWNQNRGPQSGGSSTEGSRPPRPFNSGRPGPGGPSKPGRPTKWNQNRGPQGGGSSTEGSRPPRPFNSGRPGPGGPSKPGRPNKWHQNRGLQGGGSSTEGSRPPRSFNSGRPSGPGRPSNPGRPNKWTQNRGPQSGGSRSEGSGPRRPSGSSRPENSFKGKNPGKPFRPNPHLRPK
jgi:23S rRNA pseudouridine2605 synthase